jgi:hypothetical protein
VSARTPSLPCPPWCEGGHEGEFASTSHQAHRDIGDGEDCYVTLFMHDYGVGNDVLACYNGQVSVHVTWRKPDRAVIRDLGQAGELADLAEAFGRDDIAALIRELAELADGAR